MMIEMIEMMEMMIRDDRDDRDDDKDDDKEVVEVSDCQPALSSMMRGRMSSCTRRLIVSYAQVSLVFDLKLGLKLGVRC